MQPLMALVFGTLFGLGLAVSGMTDTAKVQGFLDLFGAWDPALVFVMGGGVMTTVIGFRWVLRRKHPLMAGQFFLPASNVIDQRLLSGAALFGIGWGLYGYCPGPGIASMYYGQTDTFLFVLAMIAGMLASQAVDRMQANRSAASA